MRQDLTIVRKVRNKFAHKFDLELTFQTHQQINDLCSNLVSAKACLDGFSELSKDSGIRPSNEVFLAPHAVEQMRDVFKPPRKRFELAVEMLAQVLHDIPDTQQEGYSGPDLVKESYDAVAQLRVVGRFVGKAPGK